MRTLCDLDYYYYYYYYYFFYYYSIWTSEGSTQAGSSLEGVEILGPQGISQTFRIGDS